MNCSRCAGVGVSEGDFLLAVNGLPLESTTNIYEAFEMTAQKLVTLTISDSPTLGASATQRDVDVVTLSGAAEQKVRQWTWVEERKKIVDELSGGRLGYISMPNTGPEGYTSFNRGKKREMHAFGWQMSICQVLLWTTVMFRKPEIGTTGDTAQGFSRSSVRPHSSSQRTYACVAVPFVLDNFRQRLRMLSVHAWLTGKEGLVIDERTNGGGCVADYVLDMLARYPYGYFNRRDHKAYPVRFQQFIICCCVKSLLQTGDVVPIPGKA